MSAAKDKMRNFGFLIKDIGRLYTKLFEHYAGHLGVTLAEAKVLTYLSRNAGLSQIQLADLTGVEPMSLVRILDRMEEDKWIERRVHPTDRRARQLYLREGAQPTLDQILELSAQVRGQVLAGFKSDERNVMIDLLDPVHTQMLQMLSDQTGKALKRERLTDGSEPRTGRKNTGPRGNRASERSVRTKAVKIQRDTR